MQATDISELPAAEQQGRLQGTDLWYQSGFTWATVAMAQVIRSRLSATRAGATLYFIPAQDYVLNRPLNPKITNAHIMEHIAAVPNMNTTGRLPGIAMLHLGMVVRLTITVEAPEAVTDAVGTVVGIDVHPDDALSAAAEDAEPPRATRTLRKLPLAVIVKLDNVTTEFLPPRPCQQHSFAEPQRDCPRCDFRKGCIAVEPRLSRGTFKVEVPEPGSDRVYELRVQRRQVPMTIKSASTLHTLQGTTTEPGLIFHWRFPRFFSEELRWLATYVALSRPPSFKQLISIGIPDSLRDIIEDGPPEGILSRYDAMFNDVEEETRMRASELLARLGWAQDDLPDRR